MQIKDGEIYREETGENDSKPTEFTTKIRDMLLPNVKAEITIEGNTYIYDCGTSTITFKFAEDWNSVEMTEAGRVGEESGSSTTKFIIQ